MTAPTTPAPHTPLPNGYTRGYAQSRRKQTSNSEQARSESALGHTATAGGGSLLGRSAPHSVEAEQAILGAILIDNNAFHRVSSILRGHHFFVPLYREIFETTEQLVAAGRQVDPITLSPYFQGAEPIDIETSVVQHLGTLAVNATTTINALHYAHTIVDLAKRRDVILISEDMLRSAYDAPANFSLDEQIGEAVTRLHTLHGSVSEFQALSAASFGGSPIPPREWHASGLLPANDITQQR